VENGEKAGVVVIAIIVLGAGTGCPRQGFCPSGTTSLCDIAGMDCVERVFDEVACLRGSMDAMVPPVRMITEAQYADEIRASIVPGSINPFYLEARRMLLFDPGASDDMMSLEELIQQSARFASAFYSQTTKMVTIVVHAELSFARTRSHEDH
jgi:hypothetical protein